MDEVLLKWCRHAGINPQLIENRLPIHHVDSSELRTLVRQVRKDERRKTTDEITRKWEEHKGWDNGKDNR